MNDLAFRHFAGASFLAGYIGGILGLGGGILLTPIWLSINVEAGECVATSVFCQFSTCTVLCYTVVINMAITFEMMWYYNDNLLLKLLYKIIKKVFHYFVSHQ